MREGHGNKGSGFALWGISRPTISACLIVKDEEKHMDRVLGSLARLVDEIVVVDTGSGDGTIAKALEHGVRLFHHTWENDFAAARNYSMDRATGDWILIVDADEELREEDREPLWSAAADPSVDAFFFSVDNVGEDGRTRTSTRGVRMVRNRPEFRYRGKIHEQIVPALLAQDAVIRQVPVTIRHYGYQRSVREEKGKSERNMQQLRAAAAGAARDPFLSFNLGLEYMAVGDYAAAVDHLARSLEIGPDFAADWVPALFYLLSEALLQLSRHEAAAKTIALGFQHYPDYTELVYQQARLYRQKGACSRALSSFLRCVGAGESPPRYALRITGTGTYRAWFAAGQIYEEIGRFPEAVNAYRSSLETDGGHLPSLEALLRFLLAHENPDAVRDYVLDLRNDWGTEAVCVMGAAFAGSGAHSMALEILARGKESAAAAGPLTCQKGWILAETGDYRGAVRKWIRISPESASYQATRFWTGIMHLFLGERAEARLLFKDLADGKRCSGLGELGLLWTDSDTVPSADKERFPRSLIFDLIGLGIRQRQEAFVASGLSVLERIGPVTGEDLAALSRTYYSCDLHDLAVDAAGAALERGFRDADLFNILGNVARERGLLRDAANFYGESVACNPGNPEVYLALAAIFEELDKPGRAREVLRWAVANHLPQNESLLARLELIERDNAVPVQAEGGRR